MKDELEAKLKEKDTILRISKFKLTELKRGMLARQRVKMNAYNQDLRPSALLKPTKSRRMLAPLENSEGKVRGRNFSENKASEFPH